MGKNNLGIKFDKEKLRYDLLPPEILEAAATIFTFGANKYGANNWQKLEDFDNRYYAALERHIQAWRKGEKVDKESGESHLSHALVNVMFLLWNELNNEQYAINK